MNKQRGFKKNPVDLVRAKTAIKRNLKILEEKLNRFRSSSPEKWLEEVGRVTSVLLDLDTARSTSEESTSSINSDETIKTIAENEEFIKQRIGGIEDELRVLSMKVMPEGIMSLRDDLQKMEDGLIGLEEEIKIWDVKSKNPPDQVQDGLKALQNALEELGDDAKILITNDSLVESSEDLQEGIEDSLNDIRHIEDKIKVTNLNRKSLKEDLENVRGKFKNIQSILERINEQSSTLSEVHKALDNAKEEIKTNVKDFINANKSVEINQDSFEPFADLEEEDFLNFDSMIGYELTDFNLRSEEEHILALREDYAKDLAQSKMRKFNSDDKLVK